MSFGQQSGPPASAKQVKYLLSLVERAGHSGFRDARGPLGLTQRQSNGKFTGNEASGLIDRMLAELDGAGAPGGNNLHGSGSDGRFSAAPTGIELSARERQEDQQASLLRGMPAGLIAAELERRGWAVSSSPSDAM